MKLDKREDYFFDTKRVSDILRDSFYTGVFAYGDKNKKVYNFNDIYDFTPMVSVEDFMKINKTDDLDRFVMSQVNQKLPQVAELLPRSVYCSECNQQMNAGVSKGNSKRYYYFRCRNEECTRFNRSTRAKIVVSYAVEFLKVHKFTTRSCYQEFLSRLDDLKRNERKALDRELLTLKKKKHVIENHTRILNRH